jgi:hypothetical protein
VLYQRLVDLLVAHLAQIVLVKEIGRAQLLHRAHQHVQLLF